MNILSCFYGKKPRCGRAAIDTTYQDENGVWICIHCGKKLKKEIEK